MVMLGAVLLLASLNVATLLLSRADARQREIATRVALGAGRWRIVRQLLTETIVLAGAAGALGLAMAGWGARTLLAVVTPSLDSPPIELTSDLRLAAFTLSVSFLVCLIAGLIPSLRATSAVRLAGSRQVGGGRQRRLLDRTLVGAQVGLSLVLLVAAGLFVRTLANLWQQDPGYTRENVLMFSVDARLAGKTGPAIAATYRAVLDALQSMPGAGAVTVSAVRPVSDNRYFVSGVSEIGDKVLAPEQRVRFAFNNVGPGYFSTLRDQTDRRAGLRRPRSARVAEGGDHQPAHGPPLRRIADRPASRARAGRPRGHRGRQRRPVCQRPRSAARGRVLPALPAAGQSRWMFRPSRCGSPARSPM